MKKVVLIIISSILLFTAIAYASVDYKCVQDCVSKGYSYGYCQKACSY